MSIEAFIEQVRTGKPVVVSQSGKPVCMSLPQMEAIVRALRDGRPMVI